MHSLQACTAWMQPCVKCSCNLVVVYRLVWRGHCSHVVWSVTMCPLCFLFFLQMYNIPPSHTYVPCFSLANIPYLCLTNVPYFSCKHTLFRSWTYAISLMNIRYFAHEPTLFLAYPILSFRQIVPLSWTYHVSLFWEHFWLYLHDLNNEPTSRIEVVNSA